MALRTILGSAVKATFGRGAAKVAALFVVPFLDDDSRNNHPVFGVRDATDLSWKNIAFRNGAHNYLSKPRPKLWIDSGNFKGDPTLEKRDGFQWRIRQSASDLAQNGPVPDGKFASFRMTWGKVSKKGKSEFYVGDVMNEDNDFTRPTVQFRPVILLVGIIVWAAVIGKLAFDYLR